MTLAEYAAKTIAALIDQVAAESLRVAADASEESIHDLRVAIRRLSETLRVFEDVLADGAASTVRKDLKDAMHLAGEIRNHDIALDLANKAEVKVRPRFHEDRDQAVEALSALLIQWKRSRIFKIWRTQLHASKTSRRA